VYTIVAWATKNRYHVGEQLWVRKSIVFGGDMEEYEVDLRDYFHVLWKQKWIVIVTFVVAVVTALGISYSLPKVYETRTSLLIQPPLAKEVGGEVTGTVFAPETYKQLATAADLFEEITNDLYPDADEGLGAPKLPGSVSVEVEETTAVGFPGRFPLCLRATWTGSDPEILPVLAESWAKRFIEKNAQLFSSQTAQSYDYVKQNFDQAQQELLTQEDARDQYKTENSLEILQAEVSVLQGDYQNYFDQLREKRKQLASQEATLVGLQEAIVHVVKGDYQVYLDQLRERRKTLASQETTLAALEKALSGESEYLTLERSVSNDSLWNFLAQENASERVSAIPSLVLEDQQFNPLYTRLRSQLSSAQITAQSLREEIAYLDSALKATRAAFGGTTEDQALEGTISDEDLWNFLTQGVGGEKLAAFPSLTLEEQQLDATYVDMRSQLISTGASARTVQEEISYLESALETTQIALKEKRAYLIEVQTELERFAREISISKGFYSSLASRLQEAKIALAETAAAIRIIESPVMPTSPIGPNKKMNVAVAGVLGLFVGVLLAFFVHWLYAEKKEQVGKPLPPVHGEHSN
jgi:uncharacterized protein involved in exopolysaccharide biosynthesis